MPLEFVTLTGADDSIDPRALHDISEQYPFIEWGLLVSASQQGHPRFPDRRTLNNILRWRSAKSRLSMHVCGAFVRNIMLGNWQPLISYYGSEVIGLFDRVQLNFHARKHKIAEPFFEYAAIMSHRYDFEIILQIDGVNDALLSQCIVNDINAYGLFDLSGGAGIVPDEWPAPTHPGRRHGYAGGLGPDNIVDECKRIAEAAGDTPYWIDMETRIRSDDDRVFDIGKCRSVLEQVRGLGILKEGLIDGR